MSNKIYDDCEIFYYADPEHDGPNDFQEIPGCKVTLREKTAKVEICNGQVRTYQLDGSRRFHFKDSSGVTHDFNTYEEWEKRIMTIKLYDSDGNESSGEDWEKFGRPFIKLFPPIQAAYTDAVIVAKAKEFYEQIKTLEKSGNSKKKRK